MLALPEWENSCLRRRPTKPSHDPFDGVPPNAHVHGLVDGARTTFRQVRTRARCAGQPSSSLGTQGLGGEIAPMSSPEAFVRTSSSYSGR